MRVCILSNPGDFHAHAVAWAVDQLGSSCDILYFGDIPQQATLSFDPIGDILYSDSRGTYSLLSYDVVWLRRPSDAVLPDSIHPIDRPLAKVHWKAFADAIPFVLEANKIRCVNSPSSSDVSRMKALQLTVASRVGLTIPNTLITNNRDLGYAFFQRTELAARKTIVKPLTSSVWTLEDGGAAVSHTARMAERDFDSPGFALSPVILQEEVEKNVEVRLFVVGNEIFAHELRSQQVSGAELDFRHAANWGDLGCAAIKVPHEVATRIMDFQRLLGLVTGVMDFIVTHDGRWVFLETNPVGQFLWLEDIVPEARLLNAFALYLLERNETDDNGRQRAPKLADFKASIGDVGRLEIFQERDQHVRARPISLPDTPLRG